MAQERPPNADSAVTVGTPRHGSAKILACKRCQYKKLRCSRTVPCLVCHKAGIACEYRAVDRKRKPASQDHLNVLQNRVTWLEDFIVGLQNASPPERDAALRSISFLPTSTSAPSPTSSRDTAAGVSPPSPSLRRTTNFHVTNDGSISLHGPTSIYRIMFDDELPSRNMELARASEGTADGAAKNADHVLRHFEIDLDDTRITQALYAFFKWQYPNFLFVFRDTFLREHYGARQNSKYWSTSLLLSICALGTLMLPQDDQCDFGMRCHNAAESIAMVTGLLHPSTTVVQTFLCLAFYEIGSGNLSKGWAFSGIAFRMAQDLGFQKDPETWSVPESSLITPEDIEVRRRIYWGCYISDKLISLVLGRPVQLIYSEAKVRDVTYIPEPLFLAPWRSIGFENQPIDQHPDSSMIPYVKEQIKLARILERMLSVIPSASNRNIASLPRQDLDSLNYNLLEWRGGLCDWADFTIWDPIDKPIKPSIAALHLLYNSARIALNFDEAMSSEDHQSATQAREVCMFAAAEIHSILRRFRNQHGLTNSPLIMVYGTVQATRVLKAFGTSEETRNLMEGMSEVAGTWQLANTVMSRKM